MFKRLKTSSRIIFSFIIILVIIISGNLIFMSLHAEMVPNSRAQEDSERYYYFDELKSIDIRRGFWKVKLIPSDMNYIKVTGGIRLLNYFLAAGQNDTGIILSLSDSIKEDYRYEFSAEVYSNSLENIHLKSLAAMAIDSTDFNKLNVRLEDYARLQMKDCGIKELQLNLHNLCAFESVSCDIENVMSSMYDSSYAIIYSADNVIPEVQKQFSLLMTYDDATGEYSSNISDSVSQLITSIPECADGINWLMPFTKPLNIESNDIPDKDSIRYIYSFWNKPRLTLVRDYNFGTYYQYAQKIYFDNTEYFEGIKTNTMLRYNRGFLISAVIHFDGDSLKESEYEKVLKSLTEKYGLPESTSKSNYWNNYYYQTTYIWHDSAGFPENTYTQIEFRRIGKNYSRIDITSPYFRERDIRKVKTSYWSYGLSLFLNY